jgi:hypothetical protein
LKSANLKVRSPSNEEDLVSIRQLQEPGSQVGHEGDKIEGWFGWMNAQTEGAEYNAWVGQGLMNEMLIPLRELGVGMKKNQYIALCLTCPFILLKPPACPRNKNMWGILTGHPDGTVLAAAIHHDDLSSARLKALERLA